MGRKFAHVYEAYSFHFSSFTSLNYLNIFWMYILGESQIHKKVFWCEIKHEECFCVDCVIFTERIVIFNQNFNATADCRDWRNLYVVWAVDPGARTKLHSWLDLAGCSIWWREREAICWAREICGEEGSDFRVICWASNNISPCALIMQVG